METYLTVTKEASDFFIEKKSRFIGSCCPAKTEEEALEFITNTKKLFADASHNVYAYILRNGGLMRFSDDGEPQGKAGIPVIEAMKKAGVVDTVVVATRYYGGTMLGGGGLIRAYSHTASIAMEASQKVTIGLYQKCKLVCDYSLFGKIQPMVLENRGKLEDTEFLDMVSMTYLIEPELLEVLEQKFADASSGKLKVELIQKVYHPKF